ncbi:16S rRNA (guanine(527)-N(7))-methyltransferase RsmG [Qipengyuania marisflavi]|uniref:Ribosomal RNA small subunit methyltransferase G n=1 Tax=Qipengyuania marisflavi TaxID=2486356 RepID=A0A5S3PAX5_9SPHN|nr:16S rRNA (guanine(527)-N(7))-methyltransferase RsmG [Qipengyuania marisflavi]TMM48198.1 16S rRNA (guanine(527)-N(7))-methyltransferase RsmG [Qipengyuania marisflavi]
MILTDETAARAYVAQSTKPDVMVKLEMLCHALRDENEQQNLVAKRTLEETWLRHIADSAQLLEYVPRETGDWLDLGTGAGFPGLVIAIMRPDTNVILIESRKRRIEWLASQISVLDLSNCTILGQRLELVETRNAGCISARAFAPLPKLLRLAARFSTSDTHWLLPKGRSAAQEVAELPAKRRTMFHVEQSLTDEDAGIIVGKGKVETHK